MTFIREVIKNTLCKVTITKTAFEREGWEEVENG